MSKGYNIIHIHTHIGIYTYIYTHRDIHYTYTHTHTHTERYINEKAIANRMEGLQVELSVEVNLKLYLYQKRMVLHHSPPCLPSLPCVRPRNYVATWQLDQFPDQTED